MARLTSIRLDVTLKNSLDSSAALHTVQYSLVAYFSHDEIGICTIATGSLRALYAKVVSFASDPLGANQTHTMDGTTIMSTFYPCPWVQTLNTLSRVVSYISDSLRFDRFGHAIMSPASFGPVEPIISDLGLMGKQ